MSDNVLQESKALEAVVEKKECEVILRTQDGSEYLKFGFPLHVCGASEFSQDEIEEAEGYVLSANYFRVGKYKERKHAIHVMNYLLAWRNFYAFDNPNNLASVILTVPTDDEVREIPDEKLLKGVPSDND